MLLSILDFIGRLHPVLVHLPIGILLVACVLHWLSFKSRYAGLRDAISIILFWGMIAAIASGITGYFLSQADDYDADLVSKHQWLGIFTSVVAIVFYVLYKRNRSMRILQLTSVLLFVMIIFTGHLGGSLTHGSEYLSLTNVTEDEEAVRKPIPNVQEAVVYADIVQPLLQTKCYGCHGKNKQKGGLRLDDSARFWKGGKNGIILEAGNPDESEMIKRLLLPRNHEDHMPPKEKPQLNEQEIALLHWWIASGASFQKKVKELQQTEKQKAVLLSFQNADLAREVITDVPQQEVKKADEQAISQLKEKGVVVLPVAVNSNYLMVSFVTADSVTDSDINLLLPLQQQLVWLKMGSTQITDSALLIISKFKNITRLQLDHTNISDTGLAHLRTMTSLQYLNLVGTKVSAQGVKSLSQIKSLRSVYLYQTLIKSSEWAALKNSFPNVQIDSGGYSVPIFVSDTTEVTLKKKPE